MPHYKDGKEAKPGDIVKGVPYNQGGKVVVGQILQITPGHTSCNCVIAFPSIKPVKNHHDAHNAHALFNRTESGWTDDGSPVPHMLNVETDYGAVGDYELVHRHEEKAPLDKPQPE